MSQPSPLKTLVVLINWHQEDTTLATVKAVHQEAEPGVEVMVVDNEATDKSRTFFAAHRSDIAHYEALAENTGFTGACNTGLKTAHDHGYDLVMWLNNDLVLGEDAVSRCVQFMQGNPDIGMCSPAICDEKTGDPHFVGCRFDASKPGFSFLTKAEAEATDYSEDVYLYGTALLARTQLAHQVGGFPKGYFIYWEDMKISHAFLSRGWKCRIVPGAQVFHENLHDEDDDMVRSKYYHYYMTRNALHFLFSSFSTLTALKLAYWHWQRSRQKKKKLASNNKTDEAYAIERGLKDAVLFRSGRWDMHPAKSQ